MEDNNRIETLFRKYLNDTYTEAELNEILGYFNEPDKDDALVQLIQDELERIQDLDSALITTMGDRVAHHIFQQTRPHRHKLSNWWISCAAALFIIGSGVLSYKFAANYKTEIEVVQTSSIIPPGGNRATLRLGNNELLILNEDQQSIISKDNTLVYADGSAIEKLEGNQLITLMTPRAGQYAVMLSDGTKVSLNAASEIIYPSLFDSHERVIQLKGEAYFEVAPDKSRPFIVQTDRQRIQVLGTRFNVQAYADEKLQHTTLIEGSVVIKNKYDLANFQLKPGQQAVSEANNKLTVHQVDPEEYISWKDGVIMLNGYALPEILRQLERWYDVEFEELPRGIATESIFGMLSRDLPLNDVLKSLEKSYKIKFTVNERRIMINVK